MQHMNSAVRRNLHIAPRVIGQGPTPIVLGGSHLLTRGLLSSREDDDNIAQTSAAVPVHGITANRAAESCKCLWILWQKLL